MYNESKQTRNSVVVESAERCTDCSAGTDDCSPNKQIEGRKRARSCSHDTFLELERFLKLHGLDCDNKTGRYYTHESSGEEGTDMSFLVLPLGIEQKLDIAVHVATTSLHTFLDTEQ
jgi:hypothetical protein